MANKIIVVDSGKINLEGWKKVGKSFLICLGGAAIVFLGDISNIADFGTWQTYAAAFFPWAANFLKVWLGKYESKQ